MTPFHDLMYLLNAELDAEEPGFEDFILLLGTTVAFIAFVLWCCFPITPKDPDIPSRYESRNCRQCKKLENAYRRKMNY